MPETTATMMQQPRPKDSSWNWSWKWWQREKDSEPKEEASTNFVLVPPILSVDRRALDRMSYSSFDWWQMHRQAYSLTHFFLSSGATASLHLRPPSAQSLAVATSLHCPALLEHGWSHTIRGRDTSTREVIGDVLLRAALPANRLNFASLRVSQQPSAGGPRLQFAYLHSPWSLGFFGSVPFGASQSSSYLGVRYAAPQLSSGVLASLNPLEDHKVWLLTMRQLGPPDSRHALLVGVQARVPQQPPKADATLSDALRQVDVAAEYRSQIADSQLSISMGVRGAELLQLTIFQHLARVRRVYNLFEDDDVVGITNYIDWSLTMESPLSSAPFVTPSKPGSSVPDLQGVTFESAVAWQVNKNVLVKASVNQAKACAAATFKSWWNPSCTLSLMAGYDFREGACGGVTVHVDNDAEMRYERGLQQVHTGSMVMQKVSASQVEVKLARNERVESDLGRAEADAQDAVLLVPPAHSSDVAFNEVL